jgi:hypothetical protein
VNAVRNDPDNPSIVVCNEEARANMGALENDPAFQAMSPLWARHMNDPKRTSVRGAHEELVASGKTPTLVDVVNAANKNNGLALTEDEAAVYLID